MKAAIVTGANGFIGSHLVFPLLAQGRHVYAPGRSKAAARWQDRVRAALSQVGVMRDLRGTLHCHEADLSAPDVRFEFVARKDYSPAETILFHVAGDTRFAPPDPALQRRVNVDAAVQVIDALQGRITRVVHVSTAFVAGNRTGLIRESELDCGQSFRNSYEKSKLDAEIAVIERCRQHDIPLVIVRPGIITNDRVYGRASTLTHLNAMVEVISRIQEHHEISDGQVVSDRIRLLADPQARPNIAPVDSIIPPLLRIAESPDTPGNTFHLCHPSPQSNGELVELICEVLKVKGKLAVEFLDNISRPMTRTEEMILRSLKPYAPYLNSRCHFDLRHSRSAAPDYDSHFSQVDVAYLRKVVEFQRRHRRSSPTGA